VLRSLAYILGTELILLSVRVFDEFSDDAREKTSCQIGGLLGSLKRTEWGVSNGTSTRANGQVECAQTPCQGSKCAEVLYPLVGTTQSGSIWESGGEVRDGAGKRVMGM
jgi:hypothetical protein